MLIGAHSVIFSKNPEADRTFLRDVLALPTIEVNDGWLIFGLPPAEVAIHPSNRNDIHQFFFMCDDIEQFVSEMRQHGVNCDPISDEDWGLLTHFTLPGGGKLGIYQPLHGRPDRMHS